MGNNIFALLDLYVPALRFPPTMAVQLVSGYGCVEQTIQEIFFEFNNIL